MTTNPPPHDQPSTYFVQDRSSLDELTRLDIQRQMFTAGMGGMLAEQADPSSFGRALDVGCGTGNWMIETAKTYPSVFRLVGIDASKRMIEYAQAQAKAAQVDDRVEFAVMDALLILEFPNGYFDLVNQRLCAGFLRTWGPDMFSRCFSRLVQESKETTSEVFGESMRCLKASLGTRERGKRGAASANLRAHASSSVFLRPACLSKYFFLSFIHILLSV